MGSRYGNNFLFEYWKASVITEKLKQSWFMCCKIFCKAKAVWWISGKFIIDSTKGWLKLEKSGEHRNQTFLVLMLREQV